MALNFHDFIIFIWFIINLRTFLKFLIHPNAFSAFESLLYIYSKNVNAAKSMLSTLLEYLQRLEKKTLLEIFNHRKSWRMNWIFGWHHILLESNMANRLYEIFPYFISRPIFSISELFLFYLFLFSFHMILYITAIIIF